MIDLEGVDVDALPLVYRSALSDPNRGALRWLCAESHSEPSYIAELWYWCLYLHRAELCGSVDMSLLDTAESDTRSLFKTLSSVQPSLMRARNLEIELGVRWERGTVVATIRDGTFKRELASSYSYSLLHVYLDRYERARSWVDEPVAWYPNAKSAEPRL